MNPMCGEDANRKGGQSRKDATSERAEKSPIKGPSLWVEEKTKSRKGGGRTER